MTGSSAGIGAKLATILYSKNAKIYIAARSESKALRTIDGIKAEHPKSNGQLIFLHLDLNDLTTIKKSADEFLANEARLDVLWNNAGVMVPPQGSKTAQGYELQLGTNCLAPFLFTHFLRPVLVETAKTAPPNTVRVVWVSSSAAEFAPKPPIDFSNMDYHIDEGIWNKYMRSKAGNVLHAAEFARRVKNEGVISLVGRLQELKGDIADRPAESQPGKFEDRSDKDHTLVAKGCARMFDCLFSSSLHIPNLAMIENLIDGRASSSMNRSKARTLSYLPVLMQASQVRTTVAGVRLPLNKLKTLKAF